MVKFTREQYWDAMREQCCMFDDGTISSEDSCTFMDLLNWLLWEGV